MHDNWATPKNLYDSLNAEFNFDFDPCPLFAKFNGLKVVWGERNFVNPPYSRGKKSAFIKKAYEEHLEGKLSVLLIPVETASRDFHKYIYGVAEIRFIKGRVQFLEKGKMKRTGNRSGSMLVIFKGKPKI